MAEEYTQTTMLDAMSQLEEARKRLSAKNKQYQSPVERKVDTTKYPSLPDAATDKETRLLFGALQRHVLDLEMKILTFEAKVTDLETMLGEFMTELMNVVENMTGPAEQDTPESYDHISQALHSETRRYEND